MDHRRKQTGHKSFEDGDSEVGEARGAASAHAQPPRRPRLSPVALACLGLVLVIFSVVTYMHFSQIHTGSDKEHFMTPKVVLRQQHQQLHGERQQEVQQQQQEVQQQQQEQQQQLKDAQPWEDVNSLDDAKWADAGEEDVDAVQSKGLKNLGLLRNRRENAEEITESTAEQPDTATATDATAGSSAGEAVREVEVGEGVDDVVPEGVDAGGDGVDGDGGGEAEAVDLVMEGQDYQDGGDVVLYVDADEDPFTGDYKDRDAKLLGPKEEQGRGQGPQQQEQKSGGQKPQEAGRAGGEGKATAAEKQGTAKEAAAAGAQEGAGKGAGEEDTGSGCLPLSRELLEKWAKNNTVLITFTNSIMFNNFGDTWLHHVRKAGITYWVLAVADNHTAELVRSKGASHCFLVHENEIDDTKADFQWGSQSWRLHTWQKVLVVRHVHQLGFHVINSDLDVIWMRDPLQHFLVKYRHPDYWVSMDPITTQNPIGDDGPELGVSTHHYMNTGVYFLRQTPGGTALINKWYELRSAMQEKGFHDQDGLYQFLSKNPQAVDPERRIARVLGGKVALAQLPATLFQNGYSHCINQIHKVHKLDPFEVHFVWVWGGNTGKMTRMREQRYFIDPPSYYADPYFVSYDVQPIKDPDGYNDWNDTEAMVRVHLAALDSQLSDTWHGLALAALLNRTLILPKMKCYCIQNWFENPQCRLPGEPLTRFPLTPGCPADFIFNMEALKNFNLSGRHVPFREFSFLDNERTPAAVKDEPLVVTARPGATAASLDGRALTVPAGLPSDKLLAILQPHLVGPKGQGQQVKRVHFTNPRLAFGGWADPGVAAEYDANVASLPIRWCCRPDKVAADNKVEVHHQLTIRRDNSTKVVKAALEAGHAGAGAAVKAAM